MLTAADVQFEPSAGTKILLPLPPQGDNNRPRRKLMAEPHPLTKEKREALKWREKNQDDELELLATGHSKAMVTAQREAIKTG
jgi:hypothetical protein